VIYWCYSEQFALFIDTQRAMHAYRTLLVPIALQG
jgi:hypothetical protein